MMPRRLASITGGFLPSVSNMVEELPKGGLLRRDGAAREVVHFHEVDIGSGYISERQ